MSDPERSSAPPWLGVEIGVVVLVAVGLAALRSVLSFVRSALTEVPLSAQRVVLNASAAPNLPWVDLAFQIVGVLSLLVPVALVCVFLVRAGEGPRDLGVAPEHWRRDTLTGLVIAALVGGSGLALLLISYANGTSLIVVPTSLPDVWWRVPILIASACANSALEEVVMVGYLLRRLDQRGWSPWAAVAASATLRALYHLYQGPGGMVGNAVMGVLFARWYQRTGRLLPLLVAHAAIDIAAFLGYLLLVGRVSWLPG